MSAAFGAVVRLAPAKLNLTLAVLGRRPDGFHDLHSVMVSLGLTDIVSLAPAAGPEDSLHVAGAATGPSAQNLVLRGIAEARRAVREALGPAVATPPLAARLEKRIPVAAGFGGGSSDGAAAFDGALEAWSAVLDDQARAKGAARIGSDVPFFLAEGTAVIGGRGERVERLDGLTRAVSAADGSAAAGVLLVTPAVPLSTAAVYAAFDAGGAARPSDPGATRASSEHLASELRTGLRTTDLVARAGALAVANDLAPAAFLLVPGLLPLRRALSRLIGRPVGLSGSGPTLWSLYPSLATAEEAAALVSEALLGGTLVAPGSVPSFIAATTIVSPPGRSHA
jgi:4-diphosphocytidyl-2-C-methyl-D-erythritol kinase